MSKIRELNDAFRTSFEGGRVVITAGVGALPTDVYYSVLEAVKNFDDFNEDNDPHGEHDFGAVTVAGYRIYWKIDYYDHKMEYASEDPSDPKVTLRVMTIMLAEEY